MLHESMRYAQEIVVIQHDKRGHAVAAAANISDTLVAEEEEDDFTEEELKAVNTICFRQGKPPFKPNFCHFNGKGNDNNGKSKTIVCRFCKKPGHVQKDCHACLRANTLMVDANGKLYEKKVFAAAATNGSQVNAITSDASAKSHTIGSIVAGTMNALNW